jgi:hypothetical protein
MLYRQPAPSRERTGHTCSSGSFDQVGGGVENVVAVVEHPTADRATSDPLIPCTSSPESGPRAISVPTQPLDDKRLRKSQVVGTEIGNKI